MPETKWTPGRWTLDLKDGTICAPLTDHEFFTQQIICEIHPDSVIDASERVANGQLLAAAPELYAALEKCAHWMEQYSPALSSDSLASARLALAKARSEA